jgi:hypothetical protein
MYSGYGSLVVTGSLKRTPNIYVNVSMICPGLANYHLTPVVKVKGASLISFQRLDADKISCDQTEVQMTVRIDELVATHGPMFGEIVLIGASLDTGSMNAVTLSFTIITLVLFIIMVRVFGCGAQSPV